VTFLNRNPVYEYFQGSPSLLQSASPKVAWFTFYSATGAIGEYAIGNYEVNFGGGPRYQCGGSIASSGTGSFSNFDNQEFLSLRVGPKDLDDLGVWTSLGTVPEYYTVQLFNELNITGSCGYTGAPTVPVSELLTIDIVEDCYSYLYPRARVAWLNSLQNWLKGGVRQYNKSVRRKWTITSDFLTQDQVEVLKGVVMSSQNWVYIGQDDFPYTCKVSEQSYTVKTIKQIKLYTANFTLELSTEQSMQNT